MIKTKNLVLVIIMAINATIFVYFLHERRSEDEASTMLNRNNLVAKYGTIVDYKPVGVGGLTAWTVEKEGKKIVLYTTKDSQALFMGVVWDAATGQNLSDQFSVRNVSNEHLVSTSLISEAPNISIPAAFDGEFNLPIPESMKTVDSLMGLKEGEGGIVDTLYIIIDPRCPYCRRAYDITREYVKKGHTIKWIPTVALGEAEEGLPLAATILQSKELADRILGNHEQIKTSPTKEIEEALHTNLAFMFAAFEQNGNGQAGVPVAFFIDRRSNKPRMMTGVSEIGVLEDIFGKL